MGGLVWGWGGLEWGGLEWEDWSGGTGVGGDCNG